MVRYNTDPDRPVTEILADIKDGADHTASHVRFVGSAIAPFAALLVRLSNDAAASAQRLERLTSKLFWLTVALLVVTALLLLKEIAPEAMDFYKQHYAVHENKAAGNQNQPVQNQIKDKHP